MNNKKLARFPLLIAGLAYILMSCDAVEVEQTSGPTLCYEYFRQCVSPVLQSATASGLGCAESSCHSATSAGGGNLKVDVTGSFDSFLSVKSLANILDPASSQLLVYPPNPGHPGVGTSSAFLDTGNRCYLEIQAWIQNPKDDPFHPECELIPLCIVPTNAATDC